jgi:hypothetical protein
MNRFFVFLMSFVAMCMLSAPAFGEGESSGSLTSSYKYDLLEKEHKTAYGFSLSASKCCGVAWWSWTGFGQNIPDSGKLSQSQWFSHTQGIDFNMFKSRLAVGPVFDVKRELEGTTWAEGENFFSAGVRAKLKVW